VEKKIREWLQSQGYPLEMKVARLFHSHGFRIVQSEFYKDAETGTQRETDVTARIDCECNGVYTRIQFVIECKSTPNKPWVLFTGGGAALAAPARVAQRAASKYGTKALMRLCQRRDIQDLPQFQMHKRSAYGLTQAFTTGNDITYAAATSVSKAVSAEIKKADTYTAGGDPICLIVFPLIVIDAELVETHLDDGGELAVNRINSGTLAWRHRLVGEPHTIIRVLRIAEVEAYAAEMFTSCQKFFELARDTIGEIGRESRGTT
jgi:hypothetical protein